MKRLCIRAGLFAMFACWSLSAQTLQLKANIPFPFQVGRAALPAGEYVIHNTPGFLVVREKYGDHNAVAMFTRRELRNQPAKTGVLEFNRYGNTYFLSELWEPDSRQGLALPPSRQEKELVSQLGLVQRTRIALQHN